MSDSRKPHSVRQRQAGAGGSLASKEGRPHFIKSAILHLVLIVLLLFSWHSSDPVKHYKVPQHVSARILSAAEMQALKQREADKQALVDQQKKRKAKAAAEAKKKKAAELKKKKLAKQKAEARKKALIQKKQQEKKAKEKKAREKQAAEQERLAQQRKEKQRIEEAKQAELEQARLKEKQLADDKAALRKKREQELAQRLATMNAEQASSSEDTAQMSDQQLDERARFEALIRSRIEGRWHIPPKSEKRSVVLRLRLLPSGELNSVSVLESSGSSVFDQSALNAVKSVKRFPVPSDAVLFDQIFRQFSMRFSPPSE